jgi:DNA-binding MarR family transcriptional regulator
MYSVWLTDEQQQVWRDYLAMVGGLQVAMNRQLLRDCGLSLADYDVLVALSECGPLRILELAGELGWEQSRLSHQLRRMTSRELVSRRGSDDDRRGAVVSIAEAGTSALSSAAPGHVALVRSTVFDGMTAAEMRALKSLTARVLGRLPTSRPRHNG